MARPQLSKEAIKEAMKGAKRVDKITPNMILNQTIMEPPTLKAGLNIHFL